MEIWDAYTRDGVRTDQTLVRGEPIPDGLYHLVCEVLVRHADGSYLCMKRSMYKPNYPGYYEATAGGSALCGEDELQCVKRELFEETGIVGDSFTELKRFVFDDDQCIFYTFLCIVDCDKSAVRTQEGETDGYRWMTEAEFVEFINSDRVIDRQKRRFMDYFVEMKYIGV